MADDREFSDETWASESPPEDDRPQVPDDPEMGEEERLRPPRAQLFRRRLRNQIAMLPLAIYLLMLGGFLIAREQDVSGLPNIDTPGLMVLTALVLAFTVVFRSLLFGRRERGLLFIGLWVWVTAAAVALVITGVDTSPDAAEWWPLLLVSLSFALVLTYLIERVHDARLVLLSTLCLVMGITAYMVTSDRIDQTVLDGAADYWPLLLSVIGIVLLPLAFRRRTG